MEKTTKVDENDLNKKSTVNGLIVMISIVIGVIVFLCLLKWFLSTTFAKMCVLIILWLAQQKELFPIAIALVALFALVMNSNRKDEAKELRARIAELEKKT